MSTNGKNYAEQLVRTRTGRDVQEHLRELYIERRHTDEEIADAWGVSRTAVQGWRRKWGISRADRQPVTL